MIKKVLLLVLTIIITSCTVVPKPLTVRDRYEEARTDLTCLFAEQEPLCGRLNFYEALARALKYNLDYRIKLVNIALQAGQLKIAVFTMFPALNVSGSVYNRSNKYASSGITSTGQPTDVLTSTPNTIRSARVGLSWNILDFGMGYVKAKQQGERIWIAEEESRKQLQQLTQDVLTAYWSAYSAQQLMIQVRQFQAILNTARAKLNIAMHDRDIPKETILNFEATLLEGNRRLLQLQFKYDKAMTDLRHLLNLPLTVHFKLDPPPIDLRRVQRLDHLNFAKLDAVTLVLRPELRGQQYQERIAKWGIKTAILQAFPGITLNYGWNYNSNKFLLNRIWADRSFDVAWNLLNLASLPITLDTARTQVEYERLKLMALTYASLASTRYAYSQYENLRKEYDLAHKQKINAQKLFSLMRDRQLASLASDQQVISTKLRTITAQMDEDLLLSDLSTALGQLYLSTGADLLPQDIYHKSLREVTCEIIHNFMRSHRGNFNAYIEQTYACLFGNVAPFTIQIFGSYNIAEVRAVQRRLHLIHKTHCVRAKYKHNGHEWYVLTMGHYASIQDATGVIKLLPQNIQKLCPWVQKINQLQWVT